jgi:hypothetical protein
MARFFRDVILADEKEIGHVDGTGRVYAEQLGPDDFIGWIDYDGGEVYDAGDELVGRVDEAGVVSALYGEAAARIGFVTGEGHLYLYGEDEADLYVGKVADMEALVEGAAALLFFFDEEAGEPDGMEGLDGE